VRAIADALAISEPLIAQEAAAWTLTLPQGTDASALARAAGLREGLVALEWREPPLEKAFLSVPTP
jgi:hypothetical protein